MSVHKQMQQIIFMLVKSMPGSTFVRMKKTDFFTAFCFSVSAVLFGQNPIPTDYFSSPLAIDLLVTGSFGEIRPNHFHSGTDFNVQKKIGLPVHAAADGWVSRIKISPFGFGNALYIDHPNGFTTVYGHMNGYNDVVAAFAHKKQYLLKSFDVDLFPANDGDTLWVKKGEVIGYAGNSGGSFGAHLHFEIRDTKTERIINPLLFGIKCRDNYPPYVDFIKIYPVGGQSYVGNSNEAKKFCVKKDPEGEYHLLLPDTLRVWGSLGFGIQAFDYLYSRTDRDGWYNVKMYVDKVPLFSMQVDSFAFDESRFVNASMDYTDNYLTGSRIIQSRKLPGNEMSLHHTGTNRGVATFTDGKLHEVVMSVGDFSGKQCVLRFNVLSSPPVNRVETPAPVFADTLLLFPNDKSNNFITPEISLQIPEGSLYDSIWFMYSKDPKLKGTFSNLHSLHQPEVPLQKRIKVSINADALPVKYQSKALIARIEPNGRMSSADGGYDNGFVTTETNLFGTYTIVVDSVPPVIRQVADKSRFKKSIRFIVGDNLSGIAKYHAEMNGEWALVSWDPKNRLMTYTYDEMLKQGVNSLKIVLEDQKGNQSSYSTKIVRK